MSQILGIISHQMSNFVEMKNCQNITTDEIAFVFDTVFILILVPSFIQININCSVSTSWHVFFFSPSIFSFSSNFVQIKNCQNIWKAEAFNRQSGRRPLCHPNDLFMPGVAHAVGGRCHTRYALPILQTGTHVGSLGNCVCVCVSVSFCARVWEGGG